MRVISGIYKGRKLLSPKSGDIRPTSDMVKEAVFSMLQTKIQGSAFLDLFGGTGAIAIEAASRGASHVTVCDKSRHSVELIKSNLSLVGITDCKVLTLDCLKAINILSEQSQEFDIVYIDPPYKMADVSEILIRLKKILRDGAVIVWEHILPKQLINTPKDYIILSTKKYGGTGITTYIYSPKENQNE